MLELVNVKKSFVQPDGAPLPILDIERFHLDAGEQMALVGKSGGGKTTLLHLIAGIGRPDSGTIRVAGVNIAELDEQGRDRLRADKIGYVFQTFNLLPGFTALENVMLGMTFGGSNRDGDRAAMLLDRVGLSHRRGHRPGMLSVGEQQRVAVARALANSPNLVLADEPTANVDAGHQQQVIDLLRETCQENKVSLLIVTHEADVAKQFERVDQLDQFNRVAAGLVVK